MVILLVGVVVAGGFFHTSLGLMRDQKKRHLQEVKDLKKQIASQPKA